MASSSPVWAKLSRLPFQKQTKNKRTGGEGHWWVNSVILATWEAEIKKIRVQGQSGQILRETLISKIINTATFGEGK
jgi:hypothetical protein